MNKAIPIAAGAAAAAVVAVRRARRGASDEGGERLLVVTVACPPEQVRGPGGLPEPLAALDGRAEVIVRPAPAGRGTELGLRPVADEGGRGPLARAAGTDPRQELRKALREAKSLLETGEVLLPDTPPTTRPTARGKLLELATRRAAGEGRL